MGCVHPGLNMSHLSVGVGLGGAETKRSHSFPPEKTQPLPTDGGGGMSHMTPPSMSNH